jgi:carboxypeptidase C (cathepsin A)
MALIAMSAAFALHAADSAKVTVFTDPVTTKHTVTINGAAITYEATAGHLTLTSEKGDERAKVFFIAYTKTGVSDPSKRPLTFSFNGGPGSSSVWLHLGVLGPKRVKFTDAGDPLPPPYELVTNEYSWLDLTDMVFIDPVSTGFSRAADEKDVKSFHGYRQDIESVGEFIRRYVADNKRWASPKYLIGESYGTTRASGLSEHLQGRYGMFLNGVMLVSCAMQFQALDFAPANDLPNVTFFPTFATTAWYHKRLGADMQSKSVEQVADEARRFATTDYTLALMKGDALSAAERASIAERIARYTGLSVAYVMKTNLRPNIHKFCAELLRDSGKVVGRLDSRYTGLAANQTSEWMEQDPSYNGTIQGPYSTCINDYLTRELNVSTTLPYEVLTGRVHPWDYSNVQNEYLNVGPALRNAMIMNPAMRVWVMNGYYDLATPFAATEYTFTHMEIPEPLRKNVSMSYHAAGHMMYLVKDELRKMKEGAAAFYR